MMKCLGTTVCLVVLLVSCGQPSYLITDPLFRQAAPEIVDQWKALWPVHDARTLDLTTSEPGALQAALASLSRDQRVLVGMALTADQRRALGADPRLVFFGPPTPGVRTVGVDRGQAWAMVAQRVLAEGGTDVGWVIFPSDATPGERQGFLAAWPPGRPLVEWFWPQAGEPVPGQGPVFQWAGAEANPLVRDLSPQRWVSGDPGAPAPPGSRGSTWKISTRNLGGFLWNTLWVSQKEVTTLPLETVLTNR